VPAFTYIGQVPRSYTELRNLAGEIVGIVEHGARQQLESAPPDGLWAEGDDVKVPEQWAGTGIDMYRQPEASGEDDGDGDEPAKTAQPASTPKASGRTPSPSTPPDDSDTTGLNQGGTSGEDGSPEA